MFVETLEKNNKIIMQTMQMIAKNQAQIALAQSQIVSLANSSKNVYEDESQRRDKAFLCCILMGLGNYLM